MAKNKHFSRFTSIRRFLTISIVSLLVIGGFFTSASSYYESKEQVEELFDAELAQMGRVLQSIIGSQRKERILGNVHKALIYDDYEPQSELPEGSEYTKFGHKYEKKLAFQVWDEQGNLLIHTKSSSLTVFDELVLGYGYVEFDDFNWRTFTLHDEKQQLWIQVAQRSDVRNELIEELAIHSVISSLILIPFLILLMSWVIRRGLSPLDAISYQLKKRSLSRLDYLDGNHYPCELEQLVDSINELFERVQSSAERERQFTADAAHELRTPLSVTKIHLQNSLLIVTDSQVKGSIEKALKGFDRLIQLVEQLLVLSRLDFETVLSDRRSTDVARLCLEQLEENQDRIEEKQINIDSIDIHNVTVLCQESAMSILVRNVLDNAIAYTKEGGQIHIELNEKGLIVNDEGSGIPEASIESVFDRFYRVPGNRQTGSGLGLSICKRIALLNGFDLSLCNRTDGIQGLSVILLFNKA